MIFELRQKYELIKLLNLAGIARSTYYYYLKKLIQEDKYAEIKAEIQLLFQQHKGNYGYRRITLELRNIGYTINHKTVQRLMQLLNLKSNVRVKKYRSYKGTIGRIAPNILHRDFFATAPNQKWVSDITEFRIKEEKLYLSPILDLFNGEIISYSVREHPDFTLIKEMLGKVLISPLQKKYPTIMHSDQGWHYQMKEYQTILKRYGIVQSMSRRQFCDGEFLWYFKIRIVLQEKISG